MKFIIILKFYFTLNNVMCGERKMKSNSNFKSGVKNEIVWWLGRCEITWIMFVIYYVRIPI